MYHLIHIIIHRAQKNMILKPCVTMKCANIDISQVFHRIQNTEFISNVQYTDIIQYNTMIVFITDNTHYHN